MHTDELRAELTELANEVAPFAGDPRSARRRVARRRALSGSITAVVAIALVTAIVVGTHAGTSRVRVAGPAKEVEVARLPRIDAALVLPARAANADVGNMLAVLDQTGAVESYAPLSSQALAVALFDKKDASSKALHDRVCADPSTPIFAIELSRATPNALSNLTTAIGTTATVVSLGQSDVDLEIFMEVQATAPQVAAVHARIVRDGDVIKDTYLDHQAAYAEFKKLFHDQPVLIENERPQDLPESFRVELRDGASVSQAAARYGALPGVKSVNGHPGLLTDVPPSIFGHMACGPKR